MKLFFFQHIIMNVYFLLICEKKLRKKDVFKMYYSCLSNAHHSTSKLDLKGSRMGRSDKVSLWCVALLINTRFRFFILE